MLGFAAAFRSEKIFETSRTIGLCLCRHVHNIRVMFLLWFLLVATGCHGEITGTATCETAGPGRPARVLCKFSENVAEDDKVNAVLLRRSPFNETGGKEVRVVECYRYLENEFDCLPKTGYRITGPVSDQLVIYITRAQAEHQGEYSFEIGIQRDIHSMATCILKYTDEPPGDSTTSALPSLPNSEDGPPGNSTTSAPPSLPNSEVSNTGPKDHIDWVAIATTSSVCLVVVSLTLMFSVHINIRQRRRLQLQNEGANAIEQEQEMHEMQEMPLNVPAAVDQNP